MGHRDVILEGHLLRMRAWSCGHCFDTLRRLEGGSAGVNSSPAGV